MTSSAGRDRLGPSDVQVLPATGRFEDVAAIVGPRRPAGSAGFTRVQETGATSGGRRRWLVRRELWTGAPPAGVDRIP